MEIPGVEPGTEPCKGSVIAISPYPQQPNYRLVRPYRKMRHLRNSRQRRVASRARPITPDRQVKDHTPPASTRLRGRRIRSDMDTVNVIVDSIVGHVNTVRVPFGVVKRLHPESFVVSFIVMHVVVGDVRFLAECFQNVNFWEGGVSAGRVGLRHHPERWPQTFPYG